MNRAWTCVFAVLGLIAGMPARVPAQPPAAERSAPSNGAVHASGVLTVLYADDFDQGRAELHYTVADERTGRTFRLRFEEKPPGRLRTGLRVSVRGRARDSEILLAAADGAAITIEGSTTAAAADGHRVLVMVANFRDASVSCSMACITDTMFTKADGLTVKNLYLSSSLGKVSLEGDVTGPYLLDAASTDACDLGGWAGAADAQAAAAGYDLSTYRHRMYVLPKNSCPAAGYGSVGGNPSSAWVMNASLAGVFAHEIGHNLGMDHASTPAAEYDDSTDPMAISTWMLRGVNAPHRHQLGWFGTNALSVVTGSGLYDVAPLAIDPALASAPQVLLIAKPDTQEYYYLSYRTATGFDNYIDGRFFDRLSVHRYKGDGSSVRTFRLAGLADGEQFADAANGVTVTMIAHDTTHATARIDFTGTCASVPAVALSPEAQSGGAGSTAAYTLTVTNTDAPGCPASTFAVAATLPSGWSGSSSPASLVLAPGASGQSAISLTAPASASPATYALGVRATDTVQPGAAGSASGTYTVIAVADTAPPSAPGALAVSVNSKQKRIALSWTASSDNVAVTGYQVWRNGALVATSTASGWIDSAWTPGATCTYWVRAGDAAGNLSAASSSVTVTLPPGGRKR